MLTRLIAICALAMLATPLLCQPKVGDDAPNFKVKGNVINPQEAVTLADCKGDVILIKEWQARDMESAAEMPTVQKYWTERGGKGLHAFIIHRLDFEKTQDVLEYCADKNYTFCVPMGGFYDASDFSAYKTEKSFRTTVVGVDGKIAFYGKTGWQEALDAELKKCVYPGLTQHVVAKQVEKAAVFFASREYGKAITEADKLIESTDEAIKADAKLVKSRSELFAAALRGRIDKAKEEKRYQKALDLLERMSKEFRLHEIGTNADAEAKAMRADKSLKPELKAWENLAKVLESNKKKDRTMRANSLRAFAKANPGMKAAEDAEAMAGVLERSLNE